MWGIKWKIFKFRVDRCIIWWVLFKKKFLTLLSYTFRNNQLRQQELQQQLQQDPLYQTQLTTFRAMQSDEGTLKKKSQRPQPGRIQGWIRLFPRRWRSDKQSKVTNRLHCDIFSFVFLRSADRGPSPPTGGESQPWTTKRWKRGWFSKGRRRSKWGRSRR